MLSEELRVACDPTPRRGSERRTRRSADPLVALHYQLSSTRREGALDTVVLADGSGVVVAGAGSWAACEELAAFAPLMSRGDSLGFEHVTIRHVDIDGHRVLLCARASEPQPPDVELRNAALERAAASVSRILKAA
jgi:hypothetical protein